MLDLDSNPITQILASESDIAYVNKAVMFLYTLAVVQDGKKVNNIVGKFFLNLVRAFGAIGFALPLVLGQLPSEVFRGLDDYCYLVASAMLVDALPYEDFLPDAIQMLLSYCISISYAIIKGNACAMGYVAVAGLTPDSFIAPLIGAHVAVNGHRFIESGVNALSGRLATDQDAKLAIGGGIIYYLLTHASVGIWATPLVTRAVVVLFRISCDYVDYDGLTEEVVQQFAGAYKGSIRAGRSNVKRSRSRTPNKKR